MSPEADSGAAEDVETRAFAFLEQRRSPRWSEADETEFQAWLGESTLNRVTYLRCEAFESGIEKTISEEPKRFAALLSEPRRHARWLLASAASLASLIAAGTWMMSGHFAPPDRVYSTEVGGRATVAFSDGTQIALNTDTSVRVRMTNAERTVWLDRGEASFLVTHNAARPFTVISGHRRVTDVGTEFVVRSDKDRFEVALLKGRAQYSLDGTRSQVVMLAPGDEIVATPTKTSFSRKSQEDIANELSWRTGVLKFRHTHLADAIREFNRYYTKKLVISDPAVGELTIGGDFKIADAGEFLNALQVVLHLRVEQSGDAIVIGRESRTSKKGSRP